jgi:hypothetical protein
MPVLRGLVTSKIPGEAANMGGHAADAEADASNPRNFLRDNSPLIAARLLVKDVMASLG